MKIAYLLDTYPSVTETFLEREIVALRQLGLDIEVFALRAGSGAHQIPRPPRWQGAVDAWLHGPQKEAYWEKAGELLAAHPVLAQCHHVHAAWASHPAIVARRAAQRLKLPWSFFAHARDLWVEGGDLAGKLESAQFAASCTRSGQAALQAMYAQTPVIYAPHGLDLDQYPYAPRVPGQKPKLLGVGRLIEKKGWDLLLDALPLLAEWRPQLTLIGEGPQRADLEKRIVLRGLEQSVTLRGPLPHHEVIKAMQAANCLVLPSRVDGEGDRDGLANVLLEAAALGVPLVTTEAGSGRDLVDESTGRLAWLGDAANLAQTIKTVFQEPEITTRRCRAARTKVEERYEIQANVRVLATAFGWQGDGVEGAPPPRSL